MNPRLLPTQANVAEDQMDLLALQNGERFIEVVDRRHDHISGVAEHIFVLERGQRLVLHDEDALDELLTSAEQHCYPRPMTRPPQRTKRKPAQRRNGGSRTVRAARATHNGGEQRIAKLLARAGVASRREVERMIAEGRIALRGERLTTPATLLKDLGGVTVDGKPVRPAAATRMFRFYKPQATLTATNDAK